MKRILIALLICLLSVPVQAQTVEESLAEPPAATVRGTWATAIDYSTAQNPDVGIQYAIINFASDSTFMSTLRYVEDDTVWVVNGFETPVSGKYSIQNSLGVSVICIKRLTPNPLSSLTSTGPGAVKCQQYSVRWIKSNGEFHEVLEWGPISFFRPTQQLLSQLLSPDAKSK